jgi:hypothetical protein
VGDGVSRKKVDANDHIMKYLQNFLKKYLVID